MKNIINEIRILNIHDSPIKGMNFQIENKSVHIIIEIWNDKLSDYEEHIIHFKGITTFSTNGSNSEILMIEDISSLEIEEINNKSYSIKIIFNLGHSKPVLILSFFCNTITLSKDN